VDENAYDADLAGYYKKAIALRHGYRALRTGTLTTLLADDAKGVYVFLRSEKDEHVIVALNRTGNQQVVDIPLPEALRSLTWASVFQGGAPDATSGGMKCTLEPVSGSVFASGSK
jgi:cyclomaltodextrinase / maltogenic alpha-amylase / neopullulanase